MFRDRKEAGRLLGRLLREELEAAAGFDPAELLVVALPRGGVPVAAEVAKELGADLTILVSKKIGAPFQPEFAIGAVTSTGEVVLNDQLGGAELKALRPYIEEERRRLKETTRSLERHWLEAGGLSDGNRIRGRRAIMVDDGVATGMTAIAALRSLRAEGAAETILATPVLSASAAEELKEECDRMVALEIPSAMLGISQFYADFHQLAEEDVVAALRRFSAHNGKDLVKG